MQNKKYKLTDEQIEDFGKTLYRIRALKDFGTVKAGDLGGFVESLDNLSHEGDCWVSDDARVFGNAQVSDDAQVFDDARVYGNAQVFDDARVFDNAEVFGNAQVFGNARVSGNARVTQTCTKTPIVISGLNYLVTITDNHVRVGCKCFTLEKWEAMSEEQIAKLNEGALEFYRNWGEIIKATARKHMESKE